MKIIITEKQYKTLNEERPVSNELLIRNWDNDLGPEVMELLIDNGYNVGKVLDEKGWDGIIRILKSIGADGLAYRVRKMVNRSKEI